MYPSGLRSPSGTATRSPLSVVAPTTTRREKKLCLQPEDLSLIDFVVRNQPPTLVSACLITSAEVEVAAAAGTATAVFPVIITCRTSPSRYSPSRVQDPGY